MKILKKSVKNYQKKLEKRKLMKINLNRQWKLKLNLNNILMN